MINSELRTIAKRLARRKHRLSWLIGFSDCGQYAIWQGMIYVNVWKTDLAETKALCRNGARKAV